jgi:hypothetical protein
MDACPVCDFPDPGAVRTLLERIADPDLIITLACDFAERVADLTADPSKTRKWLQAARNWRGNPKAAEEARKAAWVEADAAAVAGGNTAPWAAWYALHTATDREEPRASNAAADAADATDDPEAERRWQLEHTYKLACICRETKTLSIGTRGRLSLLAS